MWEGLPVNRPRPLHGAHPVGFDEADKDGEEDGRRHRFGAFPKELHGVFEGVLQFNHTTQT